MHNEEKLFQKWAADVYDQMETDTRDAEFLISLLGDGPKKILEPCCGSGRILVPLARAGHEAFGFDADEFMLGKIPAKAIGMKNIFFRTADAVMDDWVLPGGPETGFDAVVLAGNILYNINIDPDSDINYEGAQELFIKKSAAALKRGGFVFITYGPGGHRVMLPSESSENDDSICWSWEGTDLDGNFGKTWITNGSYDAETGMSRFKRFHELTLANGEKIYNERICGKHFATLHQIRGWLKDAGLAAEFEYADYEKNPVDSDSKFVIICARKV